MSGIIKSGASLRIGQVRAFGPSASPGRTQPRVDPELAALREEIARLGEAVAQQDAAIARHPEDLDLARAEGGAAGREAGLKEADDGRDALAARLATAAQDALGRFEQEIASLERLAPLLAVEGLEKILGPSPERAQAVVAAVRTQLEGLQAQAVVRLEVSPQDFPDEAQLLEAATAMGRPSLELRPNPDLKSGDCLIKLRLGALEVGIDQQWGRLREILTGMAEPGGTG